MLIQSNCLTTSLDPKLKCVFKGTVQIHQSWGNNHVSGKPVVVFNHPLSKEMLPDVQSKCPLMQL